MNILTFATAALVLWACSEPESRPAAEFTAAQETDTLRLSVNAPRASVMAPSSATVAALLVFSVDSVVNPDRRGLAIRVAIVTADGAEQMPLGNVALFPVNRGGRFTVRIPDSARAALARAGRSNASARVVFELDRAPVGPDRRAVRITGLEWRAAGK